MSMYDGVPADGPLRLGSLQLPEGRQISGWEQDPLLWATSAPVSDPGRVWRALHEMQEQTGLVPIMLAYLRGNEKGGRPWDTGELDGGCLVSEVDHLDPSAVLAAGWAGSLDPDDDGPEQAELVAPFSLQFPGLARAETGLLSPEELARALGSLAPARIGLVPAGRPADVLAQVGYMGSINRYEGPAEVTVVLRSWEERFGATLLEVGFDHIRLLVQRPPRTVVAAQAVAAEIWAMCDEFWTPERPGYALTDISEIASYVAGAPFWTLWLD